MKLVIITLLWFLRTFVKIIDLILCIYSKTIQNVKRNLEKNNGISPDNVSVSKNGLFFQILTPKDGLFLQTLTPK